jgi:hypothetical protein
MFLLLLAKSCDWCVTAGFYILCTLTAIKWPSQVPLWPGFQLEQPGQIFGNYLHIDSRPYFRSSVIARLSLKTPRDIGLPMVGLIALHGRGPGLKVGYSSALLVLKGKEQSMHF